MIPHSKPTLLEHDIQNIVKVFSTNIISSNSISKDFKDKLSKFLKKEYIFLYSSGTTALYELLLSLEIQQGDDVLIPSYICSSVKKAILKIGANPIYYDNEKNSWISSYKEIKKYLTLNTKLIILNHTFGIRYKYDEINKLKQLNIPLIEDNAHFISNNKKDKNISDLFIASFYSFNATKLLTTAEGGAISTNDKDLAKKIEQNKLDTGMSDIHASLGISQLERYGDFLDKRIEIANFYLSNILNTEKLDSIYFRFPMITDKVEYFLNSKKVAFRKGVDTILKDLPNIAEVYNKTISIPIYPSLNKKELEVILEETERILNEN